MKLVVTEKNDAAKQIASLLSQGKVKDDKVFHTAVYRFEVDGEEWVTIGLRGHILAVDFTPMMIYKKRGGWVGVTDEGEEVAADVPASLARPPFKKKKPFTENGVDLKGWKMEALPYLTFAPIEKLPKEKDIIRSLKNLAKKADSIIIATDFDREGELIGADALRCCRQENPSAPVSRARYSSFTKPEIESAFSNLVTMDDNLVAAGSTRQDIDLIWGAALTRYLTLVKFAGYGNVRSSGRVQTPTLALIVEKERERMAFVPEDYWVIKAAFDASATSGPTDVEGEMCFTAAYHQARIKDEASANKVMADIEGANSGRIMSIEKKKRTVAAPTPFNTTSLMAAASSEGISPARCMRMAESLYMSGYISYPRVDNTVYPSSLDLRELVKMLSGNPAYAPYCSKLMAQNDLKPTRGKKETTDHPPIYPTALATPDDLNPSEFKLYNLVARRFLATLSDAAVVEGTKVSIDVKGQEFVAKGDVLVKPGFREIYHYGLKKDETLPTMQDGQQIAFNGGTCTKDQTKPPARYSPGKLIQEMERLGLGTKSTRHSIIERLYQVKYIVNEPIEPTKLGIAVIDALDKFAPHITHPEMTAELERGMDDIAEGKDTKEHVVMDSRELLLKELEELIPHSEEVALALGDAVAADAYVGKCPKCGKDLQIRASSKTKSMFIGCAGWPDCDVTYPLPKGRVEAQEEPCPTCGMPQVKVTAFRSKPRTICIDPNCATNQEDDVVIGTCPVCAAAGKTSKLIARRNPKTLKRSATCENFEECQTRYPLPQYGDITATEDVCEHCGAPMVIITNNNRPWKLCPNFDCPGKEAEKAANATKGTKSKQASRSRKTTKKK
ncbi:MAG: DNA topoisomerase I [Eggerthellaceae bacterium]|nr:DNA topoisomerase I [Eggerthellaceae bacterium]